MRLIRAMIEHAGGKLHDAREIVPIGVLRAVIAIADAPEEKLRSAALEVLGELSEPRVRDFAAARGALLTGESVIAVVRNLALLVVSDGLRTVLEALSDSMLDFGRHAARLFLVAVDHPETRQWLRPGIDLEVSETRLRIQQQPCSDF